MTNPQFVYLLGMIIGKGTIIRDKYNTEIRIEMPHKLLTIQGQNTELSIKSSLEDIRNVINPLIGVSLSSTHQKSKTIIQFTKPNGDFLIREINRYLGNQSSWQKFRIPDYIMTNSVDMKKEFLIGLSDVTAHIRQSNNAFGYKYHHRVYIEIPQNWYLVIDIANLLKSLDIPIHVINWGHPNIRDTNLKDYNKGNKNASFREHQIKIFADEFLPIGFRIRHKREALISLAEMNKQEWNKHITDSIKNAKNEKNRHKYTLQLNQLSTSHHRFYWEVKPTSKEKPIHPLEDDSKIPKRIRGKHFNSWTEISKQLGYYK